MKSTILAILILLGFNVSAQISEGGMPYSSSNHLKSQAKTPEYKLKKLNTSTLNSEDSKNPTPYRYSIFEDAAINIKNGSSEVINNPQGTIWKYVISSPQAHSIQLEFDTFLIPKGAKLFIYNQDYSTIYGAFTSKNVQSDYKFIIADFPGQSLTIEYFEPINAEFKGVVIVGKIGQAYKDVLNQEMKDEATNYIDINCDEGIEWQTEKHAVCKITFRVGRSGYLCSGALINNTQNDGTPYFLTASHCISDSAAAKTVVAYFNFEKKTCNGVTESYKTLIGSNLATTGSKSDYTLLLLSSSPSSGLLPYFAGWDISNYQDDLNVSIHHPEGLEKKISIDNDKITTYDYQISWDEGETTPPSTHWLVNFDKGLTNTGSSGSPLFSKQKRIIGQLHGGGDAEEFYGKLNYSWTNSNAGYKTLKSFLDPKNTGTNVLNGYYPSTNPPDAFFTPEFSNVCLNSPIELKQNSAFSPSNNSWTISPATFKYLNNTGTNSVNPVIEFTETGSYNIKLNVANANGKDSLVIPNAVTAGNTINVGIYSGLNNSFCYNSFDSLVLTGTGANTYLWSLGDQIPAPFYFSETLNDTAILKAHRDVILDTTYQLNVMLIGKQGTCADTAKTNIEFIRISNDNIAEAIDIGLGTSIVYSNRCASVEENEPVPPFGTCTGQLSWCDEYGNGKNIVENSVWFKFKGPSTGKASLKSLGFDNEIAVYSANSYQDILLGNYTLLGANDDESSTESSPTIKDITVIPGKTYWVQVDGSGGGTEGSFTLTLTDKIITPTNEIYNNDNNIALFPQPAHESITIRNEKANKNIEVKIYNLSGQVLQEKTFYHLDGNALTLDIEGLAPGIYLLKIKNDDQISVLKFIKN
jgi:hypothetical protein